ncbi:hypothetical protein JZO66_14160 [Enterococcus sp. DIV0242_7C1]|uniref:WxL domain-containing protein n=2 Tax=Candidatus Enterococcus dunnyi TaxID=1834192 RepID=A0A200JDB3_9ENTE|nr:MULTISPECIES: hypothetical protein [unclassified Enterococcus]MBO0471698.1 hypothetical protein [Enterococcus sp. DIV0242_7C1]OUZ34557.1 hypothetical protein A5889_000032 [Enterococcus sp. 9D6_DIV0238]
MKRVGTVLSLCVLLLFVIGDSIRATADESQTALQTTSTENLNESTESSSEMSSEINIQSTDQTEETINSKKEVVENETVPTDVKEYVAPDPRTVSVGNSTLSSSVASGSYGQDIVTISYDYSITVIGLAINDKPIIAIQLPSEIANQINNDVTKQQDFLALLTGTVSYPGTTNQDIHSTTNSVSLSYSNTYNSIYVTFPTSSLVLLPGTKWSVSLSFDVGAMYKRGISIPAATGANYPIRGTFTDVGTGLGAISIIVGNNTKTGTINKTQLVLGTYPVPRVTPASVNTLSHLQTNVTGNIQQTQDSGYNYTVQLTINHTDGTTTPIIVNNIPVDSSGNFSTTLSSALEYGDTLSSIVYARSKTNTDYVQSASSTLRTVSWTINPVSAITVVGGATQLSGTATQTSLGSYQVKLQINNGTTYTTSLNANGSFLFSGLPTFQGGESVKIWIQGLSTRTGAQLLASSDFIRTVPYPVPQISLVQTIERRNAQGNWESASSVVTGQTVRYTLTATLINQPATWMNQQLKSSIPAGLTQLSAATLTKKSAAGVSTPVLGVQLLTDTNSNTQYWYYQNTLAANNFTEANTSFILQYTGVVADGAVDQTLAFLDTINGSDGGGTAIPTQSSIASTTVKSGALRFVQSPTQISFTKIPIPNKTTAYSPSNINAPLVIADGRVTKSQWHLLVRESQAMHSTTTSKTVNQAFAYRKSGVDYPITTLASEVYAYTAADDTNVQIPWNQQNGLFLKIGPDININVNEAYTAELQWILSDTPI